MDQGKKKRKMERKKNPITCRTPFKDLSEAIDLPHLILQIYAGMEGNTIFLIARHPIPEFNLRHPRERHRRSSFLRDFAPPLFLFGVFIWLAYNFSLHQQLMDRQRGTSEILFLLLTSVMALLLDLNMLFLHRNPQVEWRRVGLQGILLIIEIIVAVKCGSLEDIRRTSYAANCHPNS
ncbi:hypothetical protein HS088_TW10G00902 [Tripterygium wilfordii]|uniref:Uncharacterized protein n=1 Tax=Tripterygium wilfordii TaxID=458696 RepID=A0A7J7D6E5_TRIWF|nr:uncharacterized protein LOC120007757 [Tripterygium wilfordii]KAF5741894.1 hypothetical protein HS088_TW10G00902 [Tripterygium wilfordii]